jgi:hypothetical protein
VQHWNGAFFEDAWHHQAGVALHFGHGGQLCPRVHPWCSGSDSEGPPASMVGEPTGIGEPPGIGGPARSTQAESGAGTDHQGFGFNQAASGPGSKKDWVTGKA